MKVETESGTVESPEREEIDRRQLFRRVALLVGGAVAATALPTQAMAEAVNDPVLCANQANVSTPDPVVWTWNGGNGPGVKGDAANNDGVVGFAHVGGRSGVWGHNYSSGAGVYGDSATGDGLVGVASANLKSGCYGVNGAPSGFGVYGRANAVGAQGVHGDSIDGIGVEGVSRKGDGIQGHTSATTVRSGVYGYGHTHSANYGVFGRADAGTGMKGKSSSGSGVIGESTTGTGVRAVSVGSGKALAVTGKASFTRSGVHTVAVGSQKPKITVPGGLTASSKFIVTAQGSPGSGVYVKYAKYYDSTRFRIVLNKKATKSCKVAWMVID